MSANNNPELVCDLTIDEFDPDTVGTELSSMIAEVHAMGKQNRTSLRSLFKN